MTLLTTADFRLIEATALEDAALQMFLDAAEAEITRFAGAAGTSEEWFQGGQQFISLARPFSAITSITEITTWDGVTQLLDSTDYLAYPGNFRLQRVGTGNHPRWYWYGRIVVIYTATDDDTLRKAVQAELVKLDLDTKFGVTQETVGQWSQSFQQQAGDTEKQREYILSRLSPGPSFVVVGPTPRLWQ